MKKRVRLGVRVRLPFNIFPSAGIFVLHLSNADAAKVLNAVAMLRGVLAEIGQASYAERFVCDVE